VLVTSSPKEVAGDVGSLRGVNIGGDRPNRPQRPAIGGEGRPPIIGALFLALAIFVNNPQTTR
jgi:hypothetical protein